MTESPRPLLAFAAPEVGERATQPSRPMPRVSSPGVGRQGERLSPQFRELERAFDARRANLSGGPADEVDPELVLVFDLAGSVNEFRNAIDKVVGLEFLSEFLDEESEPDEDFHMIDGEGGESDARVQHSLYLVMSNATAVQQLLRLFELWQANPEMAFARGLGRFRAAFNQLRAIRPWGPTDRIRDTGLLDQWREHLELVGQSRSPVRVEIELWYRRDAGQRRQAETNLEELITSAGGSINDRAQLGQIGYHALLVDLPIQQVQAVLDGGADAIQLLNADEIMFVSPYTPMTVLPAPTEPVVDDALPPSAAASGLPRVALLDGLPFVNHDTLADRLIVDDPDGLASSYPVSARHHGSAMASLIIHGDLSNPGEPLDRPLYVRPIMKPHEFHVGSERVVDDQLFTDLLHRAIRRLVVGDGQRAAAAPSVRIVNLSVGAESRALIRRMSPLGRLLDWMSVEYNLLFVVSAGNHLTRPITISAAATADLSLAKVEALKAAKAESRLRGILPPGDAINALTVGALHADDAGEGAFPDTVWDLVEPGAPALYGAVGPGVGRSVKPDVYHRGGRALYVRPLPSDQPVALQLASTSETGPGQRVAAPDRGGATNTVVYTHGTSNATALVSREASRLFDLLERGAADADDETFPDPLYHPVLTRALVVHASSWGEHRQRIQSVLGLDSQRARREMTALLGYGMLDTGRLGVAASNRAVLLAGGSVGRDERHTYHLPLPVSLRAKAEWHRFTITLAYMAPTVGTLTRYRGTKVYFTMPDNKLTGGGRFEADHYAVRRGSCQHEIIDGQQAIVFADDGTLPVHVECMDDAQRLKSGQRVRYGLVVSIETKVTTSQTVHDEIRARLQEQVRTRTRQRLQP